MERIVTATEANQRFSELLRDVSAGETITITSHGKPVAQMGPPTAPKRPTKAELQALWERMDELPGIVTGPWTRDELYDPLRIALDSNVLLYAAGIIKVPRDEKKTNAIRPVIDVLALSQEVVCPFQVFGEAYHVMQRNGRDRSDCRATLQAWSARFETAGNSADAFLSAIDLATDHKLQFWDALIMSVAAEAGCGLLLSEDLQAGFTWRGLTVVNPFADVIDLRLANLLDAPE